MKSQLGRDYFWNTASSLMGSASMVLMLLVVTRAAGVYAAGIFTLATAVGQQLQTLGAYEVRPYQATDVRARFSFGTYYASRIITVAAMIVGIVAYALVSGRPSNEMVLLILVASLRVFDAFEDVFYGEFQRLRRLDIAGRANFFRVFVTTLAMSISIYVTGDLLISTVITIAASLIAMLALIFPAARSLFSMRPVFSFAPIRQLLLECLPLFLAAFLAMYLANAPRFAIERFLSMEYQAYYGILFMPALAINILAMFIFRPLLTRMAIKWSDGDSRGFKQLIVRGIQGVVAASMLTMIVVYFFGIEILNFLYSVDLSLFTTPLLVLVLGGAFNAAVVILYYALTTMRQQRIVFAGYALGAIAVTALAAVLVPANGILGAAIAYGIAMLLLMVGFGAVLIYLNRKAWNAK